MYKLMILIPQTAVGLELDEGWPEFLHTAERMPGLVREAAVRVDTVVYGSDDTARIHELLFSSQADLQTAMASPEGLEAGQILQRLTGGQMRLLIAEHHEDEIENLKQYAEDG